VLSGWTGARDPGLFDDEIHPADSTAAAWSISNLSPVTSGAFAAALELVEEAGVDTIAAHIAERVEALEDVLLSHGAQIVSSRERRAGILAFTLPEHPPEQIGAALNAAGVAATVRPEHIRLSPHASTSLEITERLRAVLASLSQPRRADAPPPHPAAMGNVTHELLASLVPAVHGLAAMLGPGNEVLLHDLSRLPDSIAAIAGDLTNRPVGGPMTDLLLGLIRRGTTQDLVNYRTNSPDGRPIRSSTLFLRDANGVAIGCLCVNSELPEAASSETPQQEESFPPDVDSLQRFLVDRAIARVGVRPVQMKRHHKAAVVRELDEAGFFLIRDSVDQVAGQLNVTRYTIYNYLNEIRG
jgi:predicted transcriptional regulator YheO